MNAGRQFDLLISAEVMEHTVSQQKREIFEGTEKGSRPLRAYSTDISAAWEVAEKIGVSLIPIFEGGWFALVGSTRGWKSPADFLNYIQTADFASSGAAVSQTAPMAICMAALKAVQGRKVGREEAPSSPRPLTH